MVAVQIHIKHQAVAAQWIVALDRSLGRFDCSEVARILVVVKNELLV